MKRIQFGIVFLSLVSLFAGCRSVLANPPSGFPPFHELTRFQLGGEGGWDYLTIDPSTRKLYIARFNRIMVVDIESGKLAGEIPETDGAHGIALVPKYGLGFATAGRSGSVTVFDLKTLKKIGQIPAGENPDAILYDSALDRIFVFNGKSKNVSVIEPYPQKVAGTIELAGKPEFAVSDESGKIFVNIEDQNVLAVIDSQKLKVVAQYPLKPCESPTGLSLNKSTRHLFIGCGNKTAEVVEADTGKVFKTFIVGGGVDATAFDSKRKLAFVSAGEGRLSIIQESGKDIELVQDLTTQKGARTLAVDPESGKVYLATAKYAPPEQVPAGQKPPRPSMLPDSFVILVIGQ